MKIRRIMLSLFAILLIFSQIGHAASEKRIQISMNNSHVSVREVSVKIDGKAIDTGTPSFVLTDRTLVPVRFIAENYGAKVDWDQKTKTVTITHESKEIKLTIDSAIAIINGDKKVLDKNSIPRLVTFENKEIKTMVPLSFLAEAMGYDVGWDEINKVPYINSNKDIETTEPEANITPVNPSDNFKPSVISNIYINKGSTDKNKLILNSNNKLQYETIFLSDSNKLVIDIKDSKLKMPNTLDIPGTILVDDENIEKVQYSQFSHKPDITRVVITLKSTLKYNIVPTKDGTGIIVSFEGNLIKELIKDTVDGKEGLVVQGAGNGKMNIMKLKNPERLVIDLLDSTLDGTTFINYNYDLGFVKGVRVSQFSADNNYSSADQIVRIVLDIKDGISDPNIKIDTYEDKIVIYPEKSFWENISYVTSDKDRILTIDNLIETDYTVQFDPSTKKIEVTIPTEKVELNEGLVFIKDGLVDEIEVKKDGIETKLFIKFRSSIEYTLLSNEIDSKISLLLKKDENLTNSDRLIVIDAGHGGKDPGALSVTKKKEKDLNLNISLKLNDQLKSLGYNTIMTRSTDEFIDLYERARIANDNYADIFVSIHGNAHDNKSIAGIQVLYCPATQSEQKEIDQHPFAKIIMDELLKGTGAVDRGIIQRPKLVVLRETRMPSILVEVGFMSNAAEEKLIFNEGYQQKIIGSIIRGIEKYLEIY